MSSFFIVDTKMYYSVSVAVLRGDGSPNVSHQVETLDGLRTFLQAEEFLLQKQNIRPKFTLKIECRTLKHTISKQLNPLQSDYDWQVVYQAVSDSAADIWGSVAELKVRSEIVNSGLYNTYTLVELPVYSVPQPMGSFDDEYESDSSDDSDYSDESDDSDYDWKENFEEG